MTDATSTGAAVDNDGRPVGRDEVIEATIKAAADLFAERNPSQVSVREIASKAGVSHALVHRYLGSKEDIFHAALKLDREQAAEYWMTNHGLAETPRTFDSDLPPGRYVRTVIRAALEGVPMTAEDMKFPHVERMMKVLESNELPDCSADPGYDPRLLLSAVTAMAAGMAVAENFFLAQTGLETEDRDKQRAELSRLMTHLMSLTQKN